MNAFGTVGGRDCYVGSVRRGMPVVAPTLLRCYAHGPPRCFPTRTPHARLWGRWHRPPHPIHHVRSRTQRDEPRPRTRQALTPTSWVLALALRRRRRPSTRRIRTPSQAAPIPTRWVLIPTRRAGRIRIALRTGIAVRTRYAGVANCRSPTYRTARAVGGSGRGWLRLNGCHCGFSRGAARTRERWLLCFWCSYWPWAWPYNISGQGDPNRCGPQRSNGPRRLQDPAPGRHRCRRLRCRRLRLRALRGRVLRRAPRAGSWSSMWRGRSGIPASTGCRWDRGLPMRSELRGVCCAARVLVA